MRGDPSTLELDTVVAGAARARTMEALFGREAAAPRTLGGYTIRDVLGRGSMGVVYLAHDERLDRSVALKLIAPGRRRDPEASAALVEEAKQIARVQHPNVVAVYEVGSHDGDAFLAMEYVAGSTLREWTLAGGRTTKQIVRMYADAGRGLAAVHDAGLLHRDFKPSNVLVTATGIPKVADFGLARIVEEDAVDASPPGGTPEATLSSSAIGGTPAYMAPEQLRGTITSQSDQFAFGIALFEALTGARPFDRALPYTLDAEEAVRRLDAVDRKQLPGWLFAVLRRAVAWDPNERWPDMNALVDALEDDPSRRRWRLVLGAAGAVVVGLGGWGLHAIVQEGTEPCSGARAQIEDLWGDARRAEVRQAFFGSGASYGEVAWARTEAAIDGWAEAWVASYTDACLATSVREEQSVEVMDLRMGCLQRARTELAAATSVLAAADWKVVARAHDVVAALPPVSACADVTALRTGVEPPRPEEQAGVDAVRRHLAAVGAQLNAGHIEAAAGPMQDARDALAAVSYGPVQTDVRLAEAHLLEQQGRYEEAEGEFREALELAARWRQWGELAEANMQLIFVVGARLQRPDDGLRYREAALGLSHGDLRMEAQVDAHVGLALLTLGDYEGAEQANRSALAAYEQTFGPEHPHVATAANNLAASLSHQGKAEEAEAEIRRALSIREAALGADHPDTLQSRTNLGLMMMMRGRFDEAETEARAVLAGFERAYGRDHPDVALAHNNLGLVMHMRGDFEVAEREYRRGLAIRQQLLGDDHPSVAESRLNLADVLVDRDAFDEALPLVEAALAVLEERLGPSHPNVAAARHTLARVHAGRGDLEEARAEHRRALALREEALGPEHVDVARSRADLAAVLLEQGDVEEARTLAREAWARLQREDVPPADRSEGAFVLARALWPDAARRSDALALARRAREVHDNAALRTWIEHHVALTP